MGSAGKRRSIFLKGRRRTTRRVDFCSPEKNFNIKIEDNSSGGIGKAGLGEKKGDCKGQCKRKEGTHSLIKKVECV